MRCVFLKPAASIVVFTCFTASLWCYVKMLLVRSNAGAWQTKPGLPDRRPLGKEETDWGGW